jgi:nucleoside-diphosphate kinase
MARAPYQRIVSRPLQPSAPRVFPSFAGFLVRLPFCADALHESDDSFNGGAPMALERTLSIIKPDAFERGHAGAIIAHLEKEGFRIQAMRMVHQTRAHAEGFYAEHKGRGFFDELCTFMSRGPIVVMCLEREDAIAKYREVIGATDPAQAAAGTVRKLYGASKGENAVHGSDSLASAVREIGYYFPGCEVAPRAAT